MQAQSKRINFEDWISPSATAERKAKVISARLSARTLTDADDKPLTVQEARKILRRRKAGKLNALVKIAKRGFKKRFKEVGMYRYRLIE